MKKKAQGISINVIIIAAIALLVLVVLSIIFLGRLGVFSKQVNECENKGGKCFVLGGSDCATVSNGEYPTAFTAWSCPNEGETCCISPA